jgi:hypothetical protein
MDDYYLISNSKGCDINNGFMVSNAKDIFTFVNLDGDCLMVVKIPFTNPFLKFKKHRDYDGVYISNMIIIKETYDFNNLNDVKKILKINNCTSFVRIVHNVEILDWLNNEGHDLKLYSMYAINNAASIGNLNVLEWYKKYGVDKYYKYAIGYAAKFGNVNVLDWIKNSNYKYDDDIINDAIYQASINNHIHVLEWFKMNNMKNKDVFNLLYALSESKNTKMFKWIYNNYTVNERYNYTIINNCSRTGNIQMLKTYEELNYNFTFISKRSIYAALFSDKANVLDWFIKKNYNIKYNNYIIVKLIKNNNLNILKWFKNNGYKIKNKKIKIIKYK